MTSRAGPRRGPWGCVGHLVEAQRPGGNHRYNEVIHALLPIPEPVAQDRCGVACLPGVAPSAIVVIHPERETEKPGEGFGHFRSVQEGSTVGEEKKQVRAMLEGTTIETEAVSPFNRRVEQSEV